MNESQVIAIVNQKGGVGKTTTAVNVASFLSEQHKKVLIVDFDPQGNASSGIGIKNLEVEKSVYHLIINESTANDVLYPTAFDNLHILPSSKDLAGAEIELVDIENREFKLKESIKPFMNYYDFIIIDCPPSLGLLTLNALVASKWTIIPVQCEYFALEGIAGLINTLTMVKDSLNENLEIAGIVLTMFDKRTALNRQVVENTRQFFKEMVFDTIIPRNIRLTEAPSHGLPISLYQAKSKGAQAYYKLAQEVINRV